MRRLQKLVRNGNSTQVTLAPQMMNFLGWLPGQEVIVELTEHNFLIVRRPSPSDFAAKITRAVMLDATLPEPAR